MKTKFNPNKIVTENGFKTINPNLAYEKHRKVIEEHIERCKDQKRIAKAQKLFKELIDKVTI